MRIPYGYRDHIDNGGWGAGWIAMLIAMLVFLVLAAVVVWFLLSGSRRSIGGSSAESSRPTPEQLLSERLARGDIDPDEYRARLAALRESQTAP
jgi:putative membrane protein